ncbi:MAG: tRNA (N6-isopentenyl adenosine(37)-C2)-methylthiotransferase MiaB [Lachnospiraceae bacterium]|nr:tRNA (N6-isopentenyl adenosine(37)-C2)-methylthiotransferase MiaB [Lachnospiraceae bacterium]
MKACVMTFGCQMNARDSEKIAGILESFGYEITEDENADFVVYNTCTVRENANTKLYGHLGFAGKYKETNKDMVIAICGCMMQEPDEVEKIKKSYPFVDLIFGTHNLYKFKDLVNDLFEKREYNKTHPVKKNGKLKVKHALICDVWPEGKPIVEEEPITRIKEDKRKLPFMASVNIMYGCNNFCTYCIVPYVRGRERSRTPEAIIAEIKALASDGVKEIMLLGQNVNSYGKTLADPVSFASLLNEVCKIDGIERVRFMTSHPKDLSDELIDVIAKNPKVCRHIHLPVQSGSTEVLRRMNRRYSREHYLELIKKIRAAIPEIAITTDIIVGFPGETEEDFIDTVNLVKESHYIGAYTFQYSKRSGTPAASMEDQVPEDVIQNRYERLMKVVNESTLSETANLTGKKMTVLVEGVNEENKDLLTGRLSNNLLVHFKGDDSLIGKFVTVTLDECKGFYFMGSVTNSN